MDANSLFAEAIADLDVSIHAPVMDANLRPWTSTALAGFNPRARDGRELALRDSYQQQRRFNPRARDGREISLMPSSLRAVVSIHAPVMDAN